MKSIFLGMFAIFLTACVSSTGNDVSRAGGEATLGGFNVRWSPIPALKSRVPTGHTPLIFTFTNLKPTYSKGVTEADWERRAQKTGMAVSDLKNFMGESAYKGPDGELRVCTYFAIQKGLCGKKLGLSVQKRAAMAQSVLAQSDRCQWIGFDPNYHRLNAHQLGAENATLHVAASCK